MAKEETKKQDKKEQTEKRIQVTKVTNKSILTIDVSFFHKGELKVYRFLPKQTKEFKNLPQELKAEFERMGLTIK